MLAQDYQPLIAIEIAERDMRKEVTAKVGLSFQGEREGSGPGLSQFGYQFVGIGPSPGWANGFPGVEFDGPCVCKSQYERFFGCGVRPLVGLRRAFEQSRDCL